MCAPDTVVLRGTARCFDSDIRRTLPERIERIVNGVRSAVRVEHRIEYRYNSLRHR